MPQPQQKSASRLVEVDALRGVAALAVVLFHFTTRFQELFPTSVAPVVSFPTGYYGVNLFFIISGFVIFMTLQRTARPLDFVVSRFSRLFPTYWVAIGLTFAITHWLGLPHKLVTGSTAVANLIMIHGMFKVPHVDGVYWTLEVELLFYLGMFVLYRTNRLRQVHWALLALMGLRLIYFAFEHVLGIDLSWTVSRLLILEYIPWFTLGICIYQLIHQRGDTSMTRILVTMAFAVVTLSIVHSALLGVLAVGLASMVYFAAQGRMALLRLPPIVWLGTISYPLYLLHENIGWSIQLRALESGLSVDASIVVALAVVFSMAAAVSRFIERPAMRWIRNRYRQQIQAAG